MYNKPVKNECYAIIPTGNSWQILVKPQGKSFVEKNSGNKDDHDPVSTMPLEFYLMVLEKLFQGLKWNQLNQFR